MRARNAADGEVILEYTFYGASAKVSALDTATLTEIVVQGPVAAGEAALRALALRKLEWVLARRAGQGTQRR